jgi:ABC-type nitrate/sulfonate/bicarbonate transport system substrate-binding protein
MRLFPALLLLSALALAACATGGSPPAPAAAGSAGQAGPAAAIAAAPTPTPVRLRAGFTSVSGVMAPIWVAQDGGYFAREGLAVEVSSFPSGNEGIQAMMAGEVDFLQIAGSTTVSAALGGGDTLVVATTVRTIIQSLIGRPEIARTEDLRGKGVGISRRGTSIDTAARVALRHAGLEPDRDAAIVQAGSMSNILGSMEADRVQAGILSYPQVTLARRMGFRELLDLGTLGIPYAGTGVSTRRSYAAQQPEVVQRYLRAELAAIHRLLTDRAYSLGVIGEYLRADDPEVLGDTYDVYVVKYLEKLPYPDDASIQGVLDELADEVPRAREVSPSDFYDTRFLRALDESGYVRSLWP